MLYQIGALTLDTFPTSVEKVKSKVTADFAKHDLIGTRKDYEPEGPGEETLDLTGQVLPFHIGGLSEIEFAESLCRMQQPQFVMRGDGRVLGFYVLMSVEQEHDHLAPTGVGFVVAHSLQLERVGDGGSDGASDLISTLLSLF